MASFCKMSDTQITIPTDWRHVGLVICVSDIIQNDDGLVICVSAIIQNDNMLGLVICVSDILQNDAMLDSWSVHLTFYRMTPCWTHDLCIWHYTEWRHVGLMICVSNIVQNDNMLDSWSTYLALYRMMLDSWSVHLTLYRMTPCWTRDLCIWHTEWLHVGLVICVSDIIQIEGMLDLWSVYLTLYRMMMDSWSVYLPLYRMTTCWTRDLCIWHFTEWRHVGLVICASDILQNDAMLDSWSVYLTLYRMTPCWTHDLCI